MGMGADDTTAQRLRLLQAEFTQPTRSGPGDGRSSRPTHAPAPINLGVVDRIRAAVYEVEHHTRTQTPTAGPRPTEDHQVYDWMRQHTAHLEPERIQAGEALIYRQGLEHALTMGDTKVVRRHPCPKCSCMGLFWRAEERKAVCVNRRCTDKDGLASSWTLAYLAHRHIAAQNSANRRAT